MILTTSYLKYPNTLSSQWNYQTSCVRYTLNDQTNMCLFLTEMWINKNPFRTAKKRSQNVYDYKNNQILLARSSKYSWKLCCELKVWCKMLHCRKTRNNLKTSRSISSCYVECKMKMTFSNSSSKVEDKIIQFKILLWFTEYFLKKWSWTSISLKKNKINLNLMT